MKTAIKAMMAGVVACVLSTPAFAYTVHGVVPPGGTPVVIHVNKPRIARPMTFKFYVQQVNVGVGYEISFCIGPRVNTCSSLGHHVEVQPGQWQTAVFPSTIFTPNVVMVGLSGINVPVRFTMVYF
jgi:hypothetical protein